MPWLMPMLAEPFRTATDFGFAIGFANPIGFERRLVAERRWLAGLPIAERQPVELLRVLVRRRKPRSVEPTVSTVPARP